MANINSSYATRLIKESGFSEDYVVLCAHGWAKECAGSFRDIERDDDVDEMSDEVIIFGVCRNYDGGLPAFLKDIVSVEIAS